MLSKAKSKTFHKELFINGLIFETVSGCDPFFP